MFDKTLIDEARKLFFRVYVDTETPEMYIGSLSGYAGDRVRIYATSWDYEEADGFRDNDSLAAFIYEYKKTVLEVA